MSLNSIPTFFTSVESVTNSPASVIMTWNQVVPGPEDPAAGQFLYLREFSNDVSRGLLEIDGTSNNTVSVGIQTASVFKSSVVKLTPVDVYSKVILSNAYTDVTNGIFSIQWTDLTNPPDPIPCPPFSAFVAFEISN